MSQRGAKRPRGDRLLWSGKGEALAGASRPPLALINANNEQPVKKAAAPAAPPPPPTVHQAQAKHALPVSAAPAAVQVARSTPAPASGRPPRDLLPSPGWPPESPEQPRQRSEDAQSGRAVSRIQEPPIGLDLAEVAAAGSRLSSSAQQLLLCPYPSVNPGGCRRCPPSKPTPAFMQWRALFTSHTATEPQDMEARPSQAVSSSLARSAGHQEQEGRGRPAGAAGARAAERGGAGGAARAAGQGPVGLWPHAAAARGVWGSLAARLSCAFGTRR